MTSPKTPRKATIRDFSHVGIAQYAIADALETGEINGKLLFQLNSQSIVVEDTATVVVQSVDQKKRLLITITEA